MATLGAPRIAAAAAAAAPGGAAASQKSSWQHDEKQQDVRRQNIAAARAVSDAIRTSLGPRGMDKMIQDARGGVLITNDGATILEQISVMHPVAKMMVELSRAQDMEAGDGTTSVVVFCGALLDAAQQLLDKGLHPQTIAAAFAEAAAQAEPILRAMAVPVNLEDRESIIQTASTSLQSKVVSQNAALLAPIACDAVTEVMRRDTGQGCQVRLQDIRVVKKLGGTVEDSEMVKGVVLVQQKVAKRANGPTRVQGAKIGLIQFCLSAPKTDMENNIVITDYSQMDRMLREERLLIAKMVKHIAATGCNCLLIQKSILRDAVNDLSLDYLAKAKILVIRDIERDDIEFLSKTLGCSPVASLDHFTADKLGRADLVEDELVPGGGHIVRMTGVPSQTAVTVLLRASNQLMLDETERSLHDALCVVRCLVKKQFLLPGGGAPEAELSLRLHEWACTLPGLNQMCVKRFAEALEVVPYTLAENAGLQPLEVVSELRHQHAMGKTSSGIDIRQGCVTDMLQRQVLQPLLVTLSAVQLAAEAVAMILKIDDIVMCR
ncbi:T-complex protein 1 subunit delta [Eimeria tenella]|uniref:T-complex protein 1 subunit delta n=1 Tax=Eimeria tenella TaxID=5802 RepID=U6L8G0_EIMTE|nr:T-complex protein 1 subunit delta [Eimeria tenella]CDJ45473.1 T-complex protein 1 subunit delta [Eimeria tenella]|eukprot:XP_013236219.1 T-complex protein 1 subunit delta [Eimeria tenella]